MLHLYYGRESVDKDQFLFEKVSAQLSSAGQKREKIFLLVPEQFTLQAERNAFSYLNVPGLMDLDILSQSRLGFKVLTEVGGTQKTPVDRYGRHMLLTKILREEREDLTAFRGVCQTHSFVEMANNLISEMKRFNTRPEDLPQLIEQTEDQPVLQRKLQDIYRIYERYEATVAEKYIDTEDYLDLFIGKIKEAQFLRGAEIWVTGFDYFPPKTVALLRELLFTANHVNVVMTGTEKPCRDDDIFRLTDHMLFQLRQMAEESGIAYTDEEIGEAYAVAVRADVDGRAGRNVAAADKKALGADKKALGKGMAESGEGAKAPELVHVEQEIYAFPSRSYQSVGETAKKNAARGPSQAEKLSQTDHLSQAGSNSRGKDPGQAVTLCQAANFYAEAESAAAAILTLIRENHWRYRDIVVICNDMEQRASVISRVFADYGIPVFIDKKRSIMHNPIISYLMALFDIVSKSWRYEDVFRLLKTGLAPITKVECDELENYVITYRVRGKSWRTPFRYGAADLGEEKHAQLDEIRNRVAEQISCFERRLKKDLTVAETLSQMYQYLQEDAKLLERIEEMIDRLNREQEYEYAEETAQIWGVVVEIFDQLTQLLGDEIMDLQELSELLQAGFSAVEIGLIPTTTDQVLVGTMQRTRAGAIKALFVIGANDGLLPTGGGTEDLLSSDEKLKLSQKGVEICRLDDLRIQEEQLGIYRAFSKPMQKLWVSYSVADGEGRELRPSLLFDRLAELFPQIEIQKDILNAGEPLLLAATPKSTLRHLTEALVAVRNEIPLTEEWQAVLKWYQDENSDSLLKPVKEGLFFTNEQQKINRRLIHRMIARDGDENSEMLGDLVLSPSGLEKYSRCPYSYFIHYGLRPSELRVFEIAGREIGDVYHEVLMKLSSQLTVLGVEITAPDSPWMSLTEEECKQRVDILVDEEAGSYREGVLSQGQEEKYRAARMKEVCGQAAWALVSHVQQGSIQKVYFESRFGKSRPSEFPPVEVKLGEETLRIEGKIDRVDVLSGDYVKIIDYKSGAERFDEKEARAGYKLQLMLYLKAAASAKSMKPAGVFYFEIADPLVDASQLSKQEYQEKIKAELVKSFKLDGIVLDDPQVIQGIAGEFSGYSTILPVRRTKEGNYVGTTEGKLFTAEEFAAFQGAVDETIEKLCANLADGVIDIRPKKTKYDSACRFCKYKSICYFDLAFSGCGYEKV